MEFVPYSYNNIFVENAIIFLDTVSNVFMESGVLW